MFEAIKYNLAHLADFTGREDRPTFWWYVLFLLVLDILLGLEPMIAGKSVDAEITDQQGRHHVKAERGQD